MEPPGVEGIGDDDELILAVAACSSDEAARLVASECAERYRSLAHRAEWVYRQYVDRQDRAAPCQTDFCDRYLRSWADFFVAAASSTRPTNRSSTLDIPPRTLVLMWHFPEYPNLNYLMLQNDAILLAARNAQWLKPIVDAGRLLNFRDGLPLQLLNAVDRGQSLVTMFDYCYRGTSSAIIPFLDYPSRTPIGVLTLARRFDYRVYVLGYQDGGFALTQLSLSTTETVRRLAMRINEHIGRQIAVDPSRWLLWPSFDNRWE